MNKSFFLFLPFIIFFLFAGNTSAQHYEWGGTAGGQQGDEGFPPFTSSRFIRIRVMAFIQ